MTISTETPSRRVALGALASVPALALPLGTLAAVPAGAAAGPGLEPELHALITGWHETHRRLIETHAACCVADDRAHCPVPQSLIATESDASKWSHAVVVGEPYNEQDVVQLRRWMGLSSRPKGSFPHNILPASEFDDRANEIIASWDSWQSEWEAAREREGVAGAKALWRQAVENYHAMGHRVAKLQAKTMAGVIAKVLAAASHVTEDELEEDAHSAVLAGAAMDAAALAQDADFAPFFFGAPHRTA